MTRLVLACALVTASLAAAGEPMRAVVRTTGPADRELLERVHGQVSDLAVSLEEAQTGPLEPQVSDQLRAALALADSRHAQVVFWFAFDRGQLLVFVAEPRAGKLFARALDEAQARSAALESGALVVRSALQAFAAGGTIGIQWKPVETAPPVAAPPPAPAPPPVPAPPPAPAPAPRKRPALGGFGDVGWQFAFDGQTKFEQGFAATLGLAIARAELALAAGIGLSETLRDSLTSFDFSRYTLAAQAGYRVLARKQAIVTLRASVGWAGFSRRPAAALSAQVTPEAGGRLTSSFLLGPEARASWRPRGGPVALSAVVGFDWVPGAPTFVYTINGSPSGSTARALWVVQPRVGLTVGLLLP